MTKQRAAVAASLGPLIVVLIGVIWLVHQADRLEPYGLAAQPILSAQNAPSQELGLALTTTVGLDQGACATTTGLRVLPGARVYYCYTATNTGAVTLTTHTIRDTRTGVIWDRQSQVLPPGASLNTVDAKQDLPAIAGADDTTLVTWTSQAGPEALPGQVVSATGTVAVDVVTPRFALTKTVGLNPAACATAITATVLPRSTAFYCLSVHNTGDITFTRHTLADPALRITRAFDFPLAPGRQFTITRATLEQLGAPADFAYHDITATLTNTVYYTATTLSDFAANGAATVTGAATSTVTLAKATVLFTKTVGTDGSGCATTRVLTVSDPNTPLYYCTTVRNTGQITLTGHAFSEPNLGLRAAFTYTLAPGHALTVTNVTLQSQFGQPAIFGPFTVYNGSNLVLDNTMFYTGTGPYSSTVAASANAFAALNATPTPTPTPTSTSTGGSDDDEDNPTDTPTVTFTPIPTPIPPTATPTVTFTPVTPTLTPTPTRSYAISLLATPTPRFVSPLALPADQAATLAAQETLVAYEATTAAVAAEAQLTLTPLPIAPSPLEMPTATLSPTLSLTPTAAVVLIVVTNTPEPEESAALPALPPTIGPRPVALPPSPPTPDYVLLAAKALDGIVLAAGWIWFILGSLVFFTVAGVLAGLSFRQQEVRRFDLLEYDDRQPAPPLPGPEVPTEFPPDDDWPASLP